MKAKEKEFLTFHDCDSFDMELFLTLLHHTSPFFSLLDLTSLI